MDRLLLCCCAAGEEPEISDDARARADVEAMADDFVNLRRLTGFVHEIGNRRSLAFSQSALSGLRVGTAFRGSVG